jgi:hypothetical protein
MPSPDDLADDLHAMRKRYGADSPIGRHCANLIKMLRSLPSYVRPAWATHESQTLQGKIKEQITGLAKLTGGLH